MAQHVFPFLKSPLEASEFLDLFGRTNRSGVARDSQVTPGSSAWLLTVKAGEIIVDGSWIYDDADKINGLDLALGGGGTNRHIVVYQSYAYGDSDPPSASLFGLSASATPPAQPTIPSGSVKLADIFIPSTAASIGTISGGGSQTDAVQVTTTGCKIVQAPRLPPMGDTGELLDHLVSAAENTLIYTQGAITYDDGAGELSLSQDVVVQTLCTTYRKTFNLAPALVRATIDSADSPFTVPGSAGTRDVLIYTLIDRSIPSVTATATLKFLDRAAPDAANLKELFDYDNRTRLVILGLISGSKLFMPGVQGQIPAADGDGRKFLREDPAGAHYWNLLDDSLFAGGARVVVDTTARNAIASDLRKLGMIVYVSADDAYFTLVGGVANGNWTALFDDSRAVGGVHVLAWTSVAGNGEAALKTFLDAQIPAARRKAGMIVRVVETVTGQVSTWERSTAATWVPSHLDNRPTFGVISGCAVTNPSAAIVQIAAGVFVTPAGRCVCVPQDVQVTVTTTNRFVAWDDSAGAFAAFALNGLAVADMPFAFASVSGGSLRRFIDISPAYAGDTATMDFLSVGDSVSAHFDHPAMAARWLSAFPNTAEPGLTRVMRLVDDSVPPGLTALTGTVNIDVSGNVTGTGTRLLRDLAVGDLVRITSANYLVASVASDTAMVLTAYSAGAQTGVVVNRCDWASSYAPNIDLANTSEFSAGAIRGLRIAGPQVSGASGLPTLTWGNANYAATKPLFSMNGMFLADIESVKFVYAGALGRVSHDAVFIKSPGAGTRMTGVTVVGGASGTGLTHYANIGSGLGGTSTQPGMVIENCVFDGLNGVGTSAFYVSAAVSGHLAIRDTRIGVTGFAADPDFIFENAVVNSLAFDVSGCSIQSPRCALSLEATQTAVKHRRLSNSRVEVRGTAGGCHITSVVDDGIDVITSGSTPVLSAPVDGVVTVTGLSSVIADYEGAQIQFASMTSGLNDGSFIIRRRVSGTSVEIMNPTGVADAGSGAWQIGEPTDFGAWVLSGCQFAESIRFRGTHMAVNCQADDTVALTMALNTVGSFVNFAFRGATVTGRETCAYLLESDTGDVHTQGDTSYEHAAGTERIGAALVSELATRSNGGSLVHGKVADCLVLTPTTPVSGNKPAATLDVCHSAGVGGANARIHFASGNHGNVTSPLVVNTNATAPLSGGSVAVNTVYYFFARYSGVAADTLRYSLSPPQANGACAVGEAESLFVDEDYQFVGSLVTGTSFGSDPGAWGNCRVTHLGNGLRRVYAASIAAGPLKGSNAAVIGDTVASVDINSVVVTAREWEVYHHVDIVGDGSGAINVTMSIANDTMPLIVFDGIDSDATVLASLASVPRSDRTTTDYRSLVHATNTTASTAYLSVRSYVENVNAPLMDHVLINGNN